MLDEILDIPSNMCCDIYEEGDNYHIDIDVPGFNKENLKVEYNNGYIRITGEKENNINIDNKKYIRHERSIGLYKRDFYVGEVNHLKINAKYKDGVLSLIVPKSNKEQSKKIEIK